MYMMQRKKVQDSIIRRVPPRSDEVGDLSLNIGVRSYNTLRFSRGAASNKQTHIKEKPRHKSGTIRGNTLID